MTLIFTCFTWVGGIVCLCGAMQIVFWVVDFSVRRALREIGWWGAFVRFLWLDGNLKRELSEEAERAKRGEHS